MKLRQIFTLIICVLLAQQIDAQAIKKVLIEKYTSANCGNCPRATEKLKEMTANNSNIIWLTHHIKWVGGDAMYFSDLDAYFSDFAAGSAPRASFDRVLFDNATNVAVGSNTWEDRLATQLAEPAYANIFIDGSCFNQTLNLNIQTNFETIPETGDIRLTVFAVEDVVTGSGQGYDQSNYDNNNSSSPLYGLGNPIVGYEHLNVTRAIISDVWGTGGVIPETPVIGEYYNQQFTYEFPAGTDMHNMRIVAVLHYHDENDVGKRNIINAQSVSTGEFIEVSTEQPDTPTLSAYPNPFYDQTFIQINDLSASTELRAYSMTGQSISLDYNIDNQGITVRNNNLASGTYLFQIVNTDDNIIIGRGKWIVR